MKELDTKEMDSEEQELYGMLRSKFNPKEMERLAKLMIIDGEKYHQEKLKENVVLGDVINCECTTENYTEHISKKGGITIYKCNDCGGCL